MADLTFRARSATEIVDGTFRLYREHFVAFLTLSTLAYIPIIALLVPILIAVDRAVADTMMVGVAGIGLLVYIFFVYPILRGALTVSVSERYLGRPIEAGEALQRAFSRSGAVVGSWLVKWIVITLGWVLGFFLLGAPGFYFLTRWFAVPATALLEQRSVGQALSRSSQLSVNRKWRILGTLALSWLILIGLSIAVSMVALTILGIAIASSGPDAITGTSSMLMQLPSILGYIIGLPIVVTVEVLLYYDERIRQEGYDIELMSAQLAHAGSGAAPH